MRFLVSGIFLAVLTSPAIAKDPAKVGYDKGFVIEQGGFKLKTNVRLQFRYEAVGVDGDERDWTQTLRARRARLKFTGHAWDKSVKYYVQTAYDRGAAGLKDFYVDLHVTDGVLLRVGQYKMPYSRQFIASSSKQLTVDRTFNEKSTPAGRDTGLTLGSGYKKTKLEWWLGLYNGGNEPAADEVRPTVVARVGYNHGDIDGYDLVDWKGGGFRFAVAANSHTDLNLTDDAQDPITNVGLDFIIKASHFSALVEGHRNLDSDVNSIKLQTGYLVADAFMPAVGFGIDLDGDAKKTEVVGAFNIFQHKHNLKWVLDFGATQTDDGVNDATTDLKGRAQLETNF